jgi:hypothetical protein
MNKIDNILSLILFLEVICLYNFAGKENKIFTELGNKACRSACILGLITLIIEQYLSFKGII